MKSFPLPRLEQCENARALLLPSCRLAPGDVWQDPEGGHRVGCLDASSGTHAAVLFGPDTARCAVHDPPYNLIAFDERSIDDYTAWCGRWIDATDSVLDSDSSLYIWTGADQNDGFQPLPDIMLLMRSKRNFKPRSFITMRNQRGYGTQKNWMAVRQELLSYVKGEPAFNIEAEYTAIPKILRGYYKNVGGEMTENLERGKSDFIRAGNVWVDVQQVFYRMEENVNGCFAQKPLTAIERIIRASTNSGELVTDFFSHSGTTLLAAEKTARRCYTMDTDPLFCEITIRRLEHYRATGKTGWQNGNPFERELEVAGITGFSPDGEPIRS